jgi:membrane protein implicated in regulation of membrane protease activity
MSGLSESERAFMIVFNVYIGNLLLIMLIAAALFAPEEAFKSTFHIATFVTLVVISIVTSCTGVIAEYFSRRQINKKKKNRVMERHD